MAHVLTIIPKGIRSVKRIQALSCLRNDAKNIEQRLNCAKKAKQQLDKDIFERENKLKNIKK